MKKLKAVKHLSPKNTSPRFKNMESVIDKQAREEYQRHREMEDERKHQEAIMRRISLGQQRVSSLIQNSNSQHEVNDTSDLAQWQENNGNRELLVFDSSGTQQHLGL